MVFIRMLPTIMKKNYYAILRISETASNKDIKIAYRRLAMEWHPDKNKSINAHYKFIEINEAYEILSDANKRAEFDRILKSNKEEIVSEQFTKWQNNAKSKAETYAEMDADKFKSKILDELKLAASYTPALGCFIFLIFGVIINLWAAFKMGPIALLSVLAFGGGAIYVYNRFLSGYSEDRKNL